MNVDAAISLLEKLIATPSLSRHEDATADVLMDHLQASGITAQRVLNNVWAMAENYDPKKPTLLLNSHHDTVKPSASYTIGPFTPLRRDGKIYGLGSNDAGASVVALIAVFEALYKTSLSVNLVLGLSAEEEVSGTNGIEALLRQFGQEGIKIDMAIVGEPTSLQPAVAERGLLVLDCVAHGIAGHAARNEGVNAIYKAISDIERIRNMKFERISPTLGDIKISVTQIEAGTQHNVLPDVCRFVADVRTTDAYTNSDTAELIASAVESEVRPRSTRLNASVIEASHPLVKAAVRLGLKPFVSPTLSDRSLMHGIAALKIGPGDSCRSHTADEFVYEQQIADAINIYQQLILSL